MAPSAFEETPHKMYEKNKTLVRCVPIFMHLGKIKLNVKISLKKKTMLFFKKMSKVDFGLKTGVYQWPICRGHSIAVANT